MSRSKTRKAEVQTHFDHLTVRPRSGALGGRGIYYVDMLDPEGEYQVLATFMYQFHDGSRELCFAISGPDGNILQKAAERFQVVEVHYKTEEQDEG
jgi:hypothetical protein